MISLNWLLCFALVLNLSFSCNGASFDSENSESGTKNILQSLQDLESLFTEMNRSSPLPNAKPPSFQPELYESMSMNELHHEFSCDDRENESQLLFPFASQTAVNMNLSDDSSDIPSLSTATASMQTVPISISNSEPVSIANTLIPNIIATLNDMAYRFSYDESQEAYTTAASRVKELELVLKFLDSQIFTSDCRVSAADFSATEPFLIALKSLKESVYAEFDNFFAARDSLKRPDANMQFSTSKIINNSKISEELLTELKVLNDRLQSALIYLGALTGHNILETSMACRCTWRQYLLLLTLIIGFEKEVFPTSSSDTTSHPISA